MHDSSTPNPSQDTHPELVWAHRGATVSYTIDDGGNGSQLEAWITLHNGARTSVCERLLRVVQDPKHTDKHGPIDPSSVRRSFLAAVVARIDHELDRSVNSWVNDLSYDRVKDDERQRQRNVVAQIRDLANQL